MSTRKETSSLTHTNPITLETLRNTSTIWPYCCMPSKKGFIRAKFCDFLPCFVWISRIAIWRSSSTVYLKSSWSSGVRTALNALSALLKANAWGWSDAGDAILEAGWWFKSEWALLRAWIYDGIWQREHRQRLLGKAPGRQNDHLSFSCFRCRFAKLWGWAAACVFWLHTCKYGGGGELGDSPTSPYRGNPFNESTTFLHPAPIDTRVLMSRCMTIRE